MPSCSYDYEYSESWRTSKPAKGTAEQSSERTRREIEMEDGPVSTKLRASAVGSGPGANATVAVINFEPISY